MKSVIMSVKKRKAISNPFLAFAVLAGCLIDADGGIAASLRGARPRDEAPQASDARVIGAAQARQIKLQSNKSIILELPGDAKDILVSNPDIADVIVRSQRRVFLTGKKVGSTNIFFFDEQSKQIASIDLVIERDLEGLNRTLSRLFPNTDVHAEGVGDNVVLAGLISSDADAQTAVDIANKFLSGSSSQSSGTTGATAATSSSNGSNVVNALKILGKSQVQLRVIIAEVNRDAMKQIGVDLNGTRYGATENATGATETGAIGSFGPNGDGFASGNASGGATALGGLAAASGGGLATAFALPLSHALGKMSASATLKALEKVGLSKTLAEPTLTAISGEEAKFLAGGQFPYVSGSSTTTGQQYGFKDFGVGLAFNPIVLSEGRISIRVKTEVSEINKSLSVGNVPGVDIRSAETALELPSGGSMMIAGLLRDTTKMAVSGVPGLRKLPILGRLFSSQEFINNQTELVVIVTPYIVNPVARKDIALPTDGFVNASEPEALLFGRLNKVYGVNGRAPATPYHGNIGFIYE